MTSLALLFWILVAVALQVSLALTLAFARHWTRYRALQSGIEALAPVGFSAAEAAAQVTPNASLPGAAAWRGWRAFRVARKQLEDANRSVCSFDLVPVDGQPLPPFLPGQFLTFELPVGSTTQPETLLRCYSLSQAPQPDYYRVTIKRLPAPAGQSALPAGRGSVHFHDQIEVGSTLQVRAPAGHFYLDASLAPVVLIGAGIGITPMLSMLNWSLATQSGREIWLFYGVRNSGDQIFKAALQALAAAHPNLRLHVCYSNPQPNERPGRDYQHAGRVRLELLRMTLPLKPFHYYLCGPAALMQDLVPALQDWGVADSHIHFEAFGPASVKRRQSAAASVASAATDAPLPQVTFAGSGKSVRWSVGSASLLDLAEANAVVVETGCRAGACGSCQTRIVKGEVAYRQAPDFDPTPGTCLLCVCTPKTDLTLEA